jgi:hypothetical protein
MSLELLTAVASVGTFVVIAATAITAVIQLHHLRGSNQIVALTEIREVIESDKFAAARHFIAYDLPDLMKKPGLADDLKTAPVFDKRLEPAGFVGDIFENLGGLVKYRIIDPTIACDLWGGVVLSTWTSLLPVTTVRRQHSTRFSALWENFEYLAVLSEDFLARHPAGTYPTRVRRMPTTAQT